MIAHSLYAFLLLRIIIKIDTIIKQAQHRVSQLLLHFPFFQRRRMGSSCRRRERRHRQRLAVIGVHERLFLELIQVRDYQGRKLLLITDENRAWRRLRLGGCRRGQRAASGCFSDHPARRNRAGDTFSSKATTPIGRIGCC